MNITKRDQSISKFDSNKIKQAVIKAGADEKTAGTVAQRVHYSLLSRSTEYATSIYEIESLIMVELINMNENDIAREYREYANYRRTKRDKSSLVSDLMDILSNKNEEVASENSNKFAERLVTQRDLVAGEASKEIFLNHMLPKHLKDAHISGVLHTHK